MTNPRIQKPVQRSAQQSSVPAEALHGDGREEEAAVRPFPIDCLPPAFAAMAMEVARVVMVDESLPGAAILAVLAASCGEASSVIRGQVGSPGPICTCSLRCFPASERAGCLIPSRSPSIGWRRIGS